MLSLSSCDQISGVQVFLATNDLQQGTNRFSIAVADKNGLEITDVDATGSKFFKTVFNNSPRIIRKR